MSASIPLNHVSYDRITSERSSSGVLEKKGFMSGGFWPRSKLEKAERGGKRGSLGRSDI